MKKKKVLRVCVQGQLDSLTDQLKLYLCRQEGLSTAELLERVRKRLVTAQSMVKLEKHILRCLEKNPCFGGGANGWKLDIRGQRVNDQVLQWLQSKGKPMGITDLRKLAAERGLDPELLVERDLVLDGRFIRLKGGAWALTTWEVFRAVTDLEMERASRRLEAAGHPLTLDELARQVLSVGEEGTEFLGRLQRDRRFAWVGGDFWFLRSLLPSLPEIAAASEEAGLAAVWEGEKSALQEAELMLILSDTDPLRRDYILSALDLELGSLRVTKRLDKLLSGLPPVAWITFQTERGPVEAWYLREGGRVLGLQDWFQKEGLEPGSRLILERLTGEERVFSLNYSGEREAEVFTEGQKVREVLCLYRRSREERLGLEEVLATILQIYHQGLTEQQLAQILQAFTQLEWEQAERALRSYPFFQKTGSYWHYSPEVREVYVRLADELYRVSEDLEKARQESACALDKAREAEGINEGLRGELIYLQNHHREQESLLQEKVRDLKQQIQELQRENTVLKGDMEKLAKQRTLLQQELEPARQQVVALRTERDKLKERLAQLDSRNVQLQGSLNKTAQDSYGQQDQMVHKLKELESRLTSALLANDDLQRTVIKLQEERRILKRRMAPWPVRIALAFCRLFQGERRAQGTF